MSLPAERVIPPWIESELRDARRMKQNVVAYIRGGRRLSLVTAPIIYSVTVPLLLLDLWTTIYQWVCFPIYGIARVPRREYFVLDRHTLSYLNVIEKANCTFCSYANGLIAYVREVSARTEQYWCPIKHSRAGRGQHRRHRQFLAFGDAVGYRHDLPRLRRALRETGPDRPRTRRRG